MSKADLARVSSQSLTCGPLVCPVERVTGVWRFGRQAGGCHRARSLPGHLLHLIIKGEYRLRISGREYKVGKGDIVYYYEVEEVEWLGNDVEVVFYSVGFLAPSLTPPPVDKRVMKAGESARRTFEELYNVSVEPDSFSRTCGIMAALLSILREIFAFAGASSAGSSSENPWWGVEAGLRRRKRFRASLDEMALMASVSRSSLVRCCRAATGSSPRQRLALARMEEARGLLECSGLGVSQIADYLGYPRLHEFSREFARCFGSSPRSFMPRRK